MAQFPPPSQFPAPSQFRPPAHAPLTGGQRFRRKAWLLLCVPLGITTWAAFLYIGIKARRARWLAWTAVYIVGLVVWILLDAPAHASGTRLGVAALAWVLTWIGAACTPW